MCNLRTGTESLKPCITHISLHVQKEERTEQKTSYLYPALQRVFFLKKILTGGTIQETLPCLTLVYLGIIIKVRFSY